MGSHASFVKNVSNPRNTHIYILMGLGGPEVKFGQIAPYFGDQKLHVLGCFWHRFGPILACPSSVYDQITFYIKMGPGAPNPFFYRVGGSRGSALNPPDHLGESWACSGPCRILLSSNVLPQEGR